MGCVRQQNRAVLLLVLAFATCSNAVFQTTIGAPNEDIIVAVTFDNPPPNPVFKGLGPAPLPPPPNNYFVNLGSFRDYIDSDGETWEADIFAATGTAVAACPAFPFTGYNRPLVYCTYRVWPGQADSGTLTLPVSPGEYHLTLYFSETTALPGERLLNLFAEGFPIYAGLDVSQIVTSSILAVPYGMVPVVVQGPVTDGALNLLIQATVGDPTLAAIRLIKLADLTGSPTVGPTPSPTNSPTIATASPTLAPTDAPTTSPTTSPTNAATGSPTIAPTTSPTIAPTIAPTTMAPTTSPTSSPSLAPVTAAPTTPTATGSPTNSPSTAAPSTSPTTLAPTATPTAAPTTPTATGSPTVSPSTAAPSTSPTTLAPTVSPTAAPTTPTATGSPTNSPSTAAPSTSPTTLAPTVSPTAAPTTPTATGSPTVSPSTAAPSTSPTTLAPTVSPTTAPTTPNATGSPTTAPTTAVPTSSPTIAVTSAPVGTTPTTPTGGGFALRIDAGTVLGDVDSNGNAWVPDSYFTGGAVFKNCPIAIAGTDRDFMYCSERWGTFRYDIPVPAGKTYKVTVHIAEIFFQNPNQRVFNVAVNSVQFNNLDVVSLVGYRTGYTGVETIVADSNGVIEVVTEKVIQNPKISGIEIIEIDPTPKFELRVNSGSFVSQDDLSGNTWVADGPYANGGGVYSSCSLPVTGGENFLYCTERYGTGSPLYNIPVPNPGNYKVVLHFAEIFHTQAKRVFNAQVNDQTISGIDLVTAVGPRTAYTVEVNLIGVASSISISLIKVLGNPKISGVHIMELDTGFIPPTAAPTIDTGVAALINCGGAAYTDSLGRSWSGDSFFAGGATYGVTAAIANTVDDTIYQTERWGQFTYNIPVGNGTFDVILHFAELFFNGGNKRLFDVVVEGTVVSTNTDVFVEAGNQKLAATQITLTGVVVTDGLLTVSLANSTPKINNPKLSAIEVIDA